jgi:hypothetical protein
LQVLLSSVRTKISWPDSNHIALYAALIVALVNGIIYMVIIPPWQHYDEPNHFEYAWLLANRSGLPKTGDYDLEMHRVVAASMIEHNFFANMGFLPDLNSIDKPAYIGSFSQLNDPPLYYLIASLPLRLFKLAGPYENIDTQYRSVQLISLILFLATILCAWGLVKEIAGSASVLIWIVPTCLALEPSFTSDMTSINDDVGAIVSFTFFLWGAVYLIRRGFSWKGLVWSSVAAVICFITKSNVYIAVPLGLISILLSLVPADRRWWFWGVSIAVALVGVLFVFNWGDAADWDRATFQDVPTRITSTIAPVGKYVFQIASQAGEDSSAASSIQQIVAFNNRPDLSGQQVTFGAWIWSNHPASIRGPMIQTYQAEKPFYRTVEVTQIPAFFTFTTTLPASSALLQVNLSPFSKSPSPGEIVYYDGLLLLKGSWPSEQAPQFSDKFAASGSWDGVPFTNLLRNGSAETAWPMVRSWMDRIGSQFLPDQGRPSIILYAVLNFKELLNYNISVLINLVRTFWAKFGWDKVSLLGGTPYRYLSYLMVVSLVGTLLALWRAHTKVDWHALILLGLATLTMWISTFMMGTIYIFSEYFHPPARYSFPVIVPTLLLLVCGWLGWIPDRYRKYVNIAILVGFFMLNIYAIVSIYLFYLWE